MMLRNNQQSHRATKGEAPGSNIHILNPKNDNKVIGCELNFQLREPCDCTVSAMLWDVEVIECWIAIRGV